MIKLRQIFVSFALVMLLTLLSGAAWADVPAAERTEVMETTDMVGDNPWEILQQVMDITQKNFFSDTSKEQLLEGALEGTLRSLNDPYSQYLSPQDLEQFESSTDATFTGVGMEVEQADEYIRVVAPFKGTPAEKAGIKTGDLILAVNDEDIRGYTLERVVSIIRGKPGTTVKLTISRHEQDQPLEFEIIRELIEIKILDYKMLDEHLGYISLTTFSTRAPEEFQQAVAELKKAGALGLVLDLRSNPGGYLTAGLEIAAQFVDAGQALVHIVDRQGNKTSYTSINPHPEKLPMVVLVNGGSASASEIVAGALQDYGIADLVGQRTYGKASVQSIFPLDNGGAIKLTTDHYLTAKEREIQGVGLQPDYELDNEEEQMEKALELLDGKLAQKYDLLEATLYPGSNVVTANGTGVQLGAAPYLQDGVTMVPVRIFRELMGTSLMWDQELQTVVLTSETGGMIVITVGESKVNWGGRTQQLSTVPVLRDGNVFLPLREVASFLGATVKWDNQIGAAKLFYARPKSID